MPRLAVFDFDSTLIEQEMIDEFAELAGKRKEAERLTQRANQFGAESAESLKRRVRLLKGLPVEALRKCTDGFTFRTHFYEMIEGLRAKGFRIVIITGAFAVGLQELRKKEPALEHIHHFECNHLQVRNGRLTGKVLVNVCGNKRKILQKLQRRMGVEKKDTMAVGDSANDSEMFSLAKVGITFDFAPKKAKKRATHVIEGNDLLEVLKIAEKEFA